MLFCNEEIVLPLADPKCHNGHNHTVEIMLNFSGLIIQLLTGRGCNITFFGPEGSYISQVVSG